MKTGDKAALAVTWKTRTTSETAKIFDLENPMGQHGVAEPLRDRWLKLTHSNGKGSWRAGAGSENWPWL